jgi:hypothetical protein
VSSDNPMLKAFWRVAPSVRLSALAMRFAGVSGHIEPCLPRAANKPPAESRAGFMEIKHEASAS